LRGAIALSAGAVLAGATGCGAGSASPAAQPLAGKPGGTIQFWQGWATRTPLLRSYLDQFEREHPGVKVEDTEAGQAGGRPKMIAAILAGTPPDVNHTFPDAILSLVQASALTALNPYVTRDKVDLKAWADIEIKGRTFDGKIVALPSDTWSQGVYLYWNKEIFRRTGLDPEKPPKTWSEVETMAARLNGPGPGGQHVVGIEPGLDGSRAMGSARVLRWLYNNDVSLFDTAGTKIAFNTPAGLETLEWLKRIVDRQGGFAAVKAGGPREPFYRGEVAMKLEQQLYPSLIRLDPQGATLNWGIAVLPHNDRNRQARLRVTAPGGHGYAVMSGSKNPETAWALTKWLTYGDFVCNFLTKEQGRVAPLRRCGDIPEAKGKQEFGVVSGSHSSSVAIPLTTANEAIARLLADAATAVLDGSKSTQQALQQAAAEAQVELDNALQPR
jgi:multiple sugar transport system substrate-binding protein